MLREKVVFHLGALKYYTMLIATICAVGTLFPLYNYSLYQLIVTGMHVL